MNKQTIIVEKISAAMKAFTEAGYIWYDIDSVKRLVKVTDSTGEAVYFSYEKNAQGNWEFVKLPARPSGKLNRGW